MKVTFTDDASNSETLTSEPYPPGSTVSEAGITISFEHAAYTVAEGSNVSVKVQLSADPGTTVTIPITKANQGGASNSDYSGVPANVTFNSGETEQTITFAAATDGDNDDGESVKLGFGTLPADVSAGSTNETVISITDDDVPTLTVYFSSFPRSVNEGNLILIALTLGGGTPERQVTIPLTTTNQGGASNSDYTVDNSVTFGPNDNSKQFAFTANQDQADDDGESVLIGLGSPLPEGITASPPSTVTVSIIDDDDPRVEVSFEQATYTVAEGSSITVKVKLDADPERSVTIPITKTDQSGATSSDYSGVPSSVTFNSEDTEQTITFSAATDGDNDDGESVKLGFGTLPTRVSAGTPSEATVSITDDDLPSVNVSFEQASYAVAEGSSVAVKVVLNADPERSVTIPITKANQGGASNSDYSGVPASVVFDSVDTEKTITFSAATDSDNDDGESVKLGFGTLPTGVSAGSPSEATVSITDDDVPAVTIEFVQATYTVAEGSSVSITVTMSPDPERTVTIPLNLTNQDGASNSDYSGVPANLTFNGGDTEQTITFAAAADSDNDDGESVKLGFGMLPTRVTAGSTNETVVSITDDDVPLVVVSFEQASYAVAEGSSVAVKVSLNADPERTVTIPITRANQDGASNSDYSGVPSNLTFNGGDTEQTITFAAAADSDNDDGESVKLGFGSSLPTGVTVGSPNETVSDHRRRRARL